MDLEPKNADDLKCNILQMLIKYPNGVKFEKFSSAFYVIHSFHPKLSHYGYSSLRDLLNDMSETVVVEVENSCDLVMKLVSGLNLDGLLDEIAESGSNSFEEEDSRFKEEERRERGEDTAATAAGSFNYSSSQSSHYPSFDSKHPICISKKVNQAASEKKPAAFSCCSYRSSYFSSSDTDESTFTSNNSKQDEFERKPVLSEVMALVTARLRSYKKGLKIWKLQELLLVKDGIDLKKFSIAYGYRDTVEFIEQKMPQLVLNRFNIVAIEPHSDLEDNSKSASTINDPSASDSKCQNVPDSIAVVPSEVNLFRTSQSYPNIMSLNLPSFHESHNTLSVKAKSSFFSSITSQQPNSCQPSVKSVTEETPGSSQVPIFQPSTPLDELKQQVAQILAKYPKGISLFQLQIVYSAMFKQRFPVGNASSIKRHLLEMPDIVYVKGHGVQTLLLPVSPDMSPAKPGQPAPSKVENVSVVSNLSLVHPKPVTKPAVKTFDSYYVSTSPLDFPEKPGSKDCCSSKDLSLNMLLATRQKQTKARTSLPGFLDQLDLSKVEDIPVFPGRSLPKDESLIIPQSFLMPVVPMAAMMPIPKPHHSLEYYQSARVLENKGNKPFTEPHTQSIPGSIKVMETNKSCLNAPNPKLREIPFLSHCFAALPTYSHGENLQPGFLKPRFASPTESKISDIVPSVDLIPVPPVLLKPSEIHTPRSVSQSSNSIHPVLPVQPPRTTAVSPASSLLDSTANSNDQIAYASAKITSNSSPLFSETQASTQQRQYSRPATTVISNTKTTSPTSWSPESITCSHHQFDSSRITTNSSNLSSETYAFTHQRQSTQASKTIIVSNTKMVSSISSPLDSTTSLPCQHAYASPRATSTSSVMSKSTANHTLNADFKTSLNAPPKNDRTSSLSKQGYHTASLQEKQVPVTYVSRIYDGCIIL